MRLSYEQTIITKTGTQTLVISGDYNPKDESIENPDIEVYKDRDHLASIIDLLNDVNSDVVDELINVVPWREVYNGSEHYDGEMEDYEVGDLMDRVDLER